MHGNKRSAAGRYLPAEALLALQQIHNFGLHRLLRRLVVQLQHQDLERPARCS